MAALTIKNLNLLKSKTLYRKYNILKALKIFEALEKI
jgi:hypothetical protein